MKYNIMVLTLILSLVIPQYLHAQWTSQPASIDSGGFISIDFRDSLTGCATGHRLRRGKIVHTSDGGAHWSVSQLPDSTGAVSGVTFMNGDTVYAVGSHGYRYDQTRRALFLKSTDAGTTWIGEQIFQDSLNGFLWASFISPTLGYTIGYSESGPPIRGLLKTTDGGSSWTRLSLPVQLLTSPNLLFLDSLKGFIVGTQRRDSIEIGTILRTLDGGVSWNIYLLPDSTQLENVLFLNGSVGFVIGETVPTRTGLFSEALVYKTTNMGTTWEPGDYTPDSVFLHGGSFVNETGVIFGIKGVALGLSTFSSLPFIARTTDAGTTWVEQSVQGDVTGMEIVGAKMITETNGYLCGFRFSPLPTDLIFHTPNGGIAAMLSDGSIVPEEIRLLQNYPNPFNPFTSIEFSVTNTGLVNLKIYNILGEEIHTLFAGQLRTGTYKVNWDASGVPSGIYLVRLQARTFSQTKKIVLLR